MDKIEEIKEDEKINKYLDIAIKQQKIINLRMSMKRVSLVSL